MIHLRRRDETVRRDKHRNTGVQTWAHHALCEHGHVLRGVVRQSADQTAQLWGRGHHEDHRLVPSDVIDVIGGSLKVPVGDWCDGTFKGRRRPADGGE